MIEANFNCQEMTLQYEGIISDSIRFLEIHFAFDEYWDKMDRTAVFSHGTENYNVALSEGSSMYLGNNTCYVPQEVIKANGFTVSVFGSKNNTLITSSNEWVTVEESGINQNIPSDPTPSAWSQMFGVANSAKDIANGVKQRADSGEFNGAGVAEGGETGQILKKASGSDYDTEWGDLPDSYSKAEADTKFVVKVRKINGKALVGDISLDYDDVGAYPQKADGIPKADLASGVRASLDKADGALQEHQDISGKADKQDTYTKSEVNAEIVNSHKKTPYLIVYDGNNQTFSNYDNGRVILYPNSVIKKYLDGRYYLYLVDDNLQYDVVCYHKDSTGSPEWGELYFRNVEYNSNGKTVTVREIRIEKKQNPSTGKYYQYVEKTAPIVFNIPTKTSELTNNSGFLTQHQDISGKQDETDNSLETTAKTVVGAINEVNGLLSGVEQLLEVLL